MHRVFRCNLLTSAQTCSLLPANAHRPPSLVTTGPPFLAPTVQTTRLSSPFVFTASYVASPETLFPNPVRFARLPHFSPKEILQNKANCPFVCNTGTPKQSQTNPIFGFPPHDQNHSLV
jgi:hypothetical protein